MLKVGVIGCGKIAQVRHLPEYNDNPNCTISAVFDINAQRAKDIACEYGARAYESYQALLEEAEIDAVSVCTPNNTHAEITIAALNAGKDVLCEKPMATSLSDCEAVVKAAKENKRILMVAHNQRLAKAHVLARRLVRNGEIGRIITFKTNFGHSGPETWSVDPGQNVWFFDKRLASMGALADLGIHKTDLIQYLIDQKVSEVSAFIETLDKRGSSGELIGVDDNAICIYKMDGGAMGTMTASWTYNAYEENSTILYGTDGIMRIYDDPVYSIVIEKKNGEKILYEVDKIQTNDDQTKSGVIDHWIDCLINRKEPIMSGEEVLHSMRVVFAALQSAKEGRVIKIKGGQA